jgi:hypothetical protein
MYNINIECDADDGMEEQTKGSVLFLRIFFILKNLLTNGENGTKFQKNEVSYMKNRLFLDT